MRFQVFGRRLALSTGVLVLAALLWSAAAGSAMAAAPPQTQLQEVRAAVIGLEPGGDAVAKAALGAAAQDLEAATAESLWIDAPHAVPPANGNAVFVSSSAASEQLHTLRKDGSVSQAALQTARGEIAEAQLDLADNALLQVQGSTSQPGTPLSKWLAAFRLLGKQMTSAIGGIPQATVEEAATDYLTSSEDEVFVGWEPIKGPALTSEGKPEVLYYGAEGCPYCGIERWSEALALSEFGKFSSLAVTVSATYDVDPSTHSLDFHGSHYKSPYVAFAPIEGFTNQPGGTLTCNGETFPFWTNLETPTESEQQTINEFDTHEGCLEALPFIDVANSWSTKGSTANPAIVKGMSWQQIAGDLSNPNSTVGQSIDGGAEIIAAQICEIDGGKPARVCASGVVKKYEEEVRARFGQPPPPASASRMG